MERSPHWQKDEASPVWSNLCANVLFDTTVTFCNVRVLPLCASLIVGLS